LYSRTAWLAALVIVATAIVLAGRHRRRMLIGAGIAAVLGVVLLFTVPTIRGLVWTTVGMTQPVETKDIPIAAPGGRLKIWKETLRMIGDGPVRGVGLGNFRSVFETTYNPELNIDQRRGVHAHNLFLQRIAELGIPGGLCFLGLWSAGLWTAWQLMQRRRDAATMGVFFSLIAATWCNLTDSMPGEIAGARLYLLTWLLFGLAAGMAEPADR
jgi:O-antigen ligase